MKKNVFYLMCGLLGLSMLFTACSKDEAETPSFPAELAKVEVSSNGSGSIAINPNFDWSIELSNKTDFYMKDGANEVYTLRGAAGQQTIKVYAREIFDFDEDHTCDVQMTMGGQTKTIATLTVKKNDRKVSVYAAQVEDGAYVGEEDEDGNFIYAYGSSLVQSISMVHSFDAGYTFAVKVNANFDWIVEAPEWLLPVEGGDANTDVELLFQIDKENYPASGTIGEIKFIDANNQSKVGSTLYIAFDYAANAIEAVWMEEPAYIEVASGSGWPFNEDALADYSFLSTYDLYYASQWDSETSFRISKPVKSFKAYSYTSSGRFEDITGEDSWLSGSTSEGLPFMYVVMDASMPTAEAAKNENNGELEGVLVVEFEDGSFTAIYCHYSAPAQGGSTGDVKIVSDYAEMLGVTLTQIDETDSDYTYDYGMDVPQYRLKYTQKAGSAALSLPEGTVYPMQDWITLEGENSYMWIYMNPASAVQRPAKGQVIVIDPTTEAILVVIHCVTTVR